MISGGVCDPEASVESIANIIYLERKELMEIKQSLISSTILLRRSLLEETLRIRRELDVLEDKVMRCRISHSTTGYCVETRRSTMAFTSRSHYRLPWAPMVSRTGHQRMDGEFLLGTSLSIAQNSSFEYLFQPQVLELEMDRG